MKGCERMAEINVNIDEILSYIDLQKPDGDVKRVLPITLIQGIVGLENLTKTQLVALVLLMKNPYIFGTNEEDEPTLYRIEVNKGNLYLSDTVTNSPQDGEPNLKGFKDYIDLVASIFE